MVTIAVEQFSMRNKINSTSDGCDAHSCSVTFSFPMILSKEFELYLIGLLASNSAGMSKTVTFDFEVVGGKQL